MEHGVNCDDIFTVQDAKALRTCFLNLVLERDKLSAELEAHRLVLGELESLREFLDDPAPGFAVNGASNGHVARNHDSAAKADDSTPEPVPAAVVDQADDGHEKMEHHGDGTPATDRVQAEASAGDRDERPAAKLHTGGALPPADNLELVTRPPAAVPHERPPQGTLMERILTAIEASDKPLRGWRIQRELGLSRMPSAELSRLVRRGHLERLGEGIFAVAGREYESTKSC